MNNKQKLEYCKKVINSCETLDHVLTASNLQNCFNDIIYKSNIVLLCSIKASELQIVFRKQFYKNT